MDTFLLVMLVVGGLIAGGVWLNVYMFKSGAIDTNTRKRQLVYDQGQLANNQALFDYSMDMEDTPSFMPLSLRWMAVAGVALIFLVFVMNIISGLL
jgi:hypothetical protein